MRTGGERSEILDILLEHSIELLAELGELESRTLGLRDIIVLSGIL